MFKHGFFLRVLYITLLVILENNESADRDADYSVRNGTRTLGKNVLYALSKVLAEWGDHTCDYDNGNNNPAIAGEVFLIHVHLSSFLATLLYPAGEGVQESTSFTCANLGERSAHHNYEG